MAAVKRRPMSWQSLVHTPPDDLGFFMTIMDDPGAFGAVKVECYEGNPDGNKEREGIRDFVDEARRLSRVEQEDERCERLAANQ